MKNVNESASDSNFFIFYCIVVLIALEDIALIYSKVRKFQYEHFKPQAESVWSK